MAAATPTSTIDLLDLLHKSRIWPDAELQSRLAALGPVPEEPNQAAALLIKHGHLTPFQARILLGGKYRGFRMGAYVIRGQIGQGGMGAVYLAHHEALRRPVAIKVLTPPDKSAVTRVNVERFLREARSAAALDHPNIVRIFDVAQHGEMHYLVMEYVEGQTLDEMVTAGGPVSCGRAVEYMLQAAAGLEHAYQKGFVHRDIKPANLILAKDGTLKILDMGLARSEESEDKVTEVFDKGAVVGTADYISPEQAMNAPDLDIRADIYSLGATFYTLLTGRPPFTGNTTQKLMQHQIKEAPSLDALDKTFPPDLARLVAKMMKKRPADRYQTPAEVMAALGPWLSNTSQVIAALSLSRSLPGSSTDLQHTLNEVVSGSTKRLNQVIAKAAEKPQASRVPYVVGGVAALAMVLATFGGLAAYALSGPGDKSPAVAQQPTPTTPAPAPSVTRRPTPPTPAAAARGAAFFSFDAAGLTDFRETWRSEPGKDGVQFSEQVTMTSSGDGKLPEGWQRMNYKVGTTSEIAVATVRGSKAFGMATLDGDHTTMAFTPTFPMGRVRTRLKIEYLLEGTEGVGSAMFAKLAPAPQTDAKGVGELSATDGKWVTREFEFDTQGATEGRLEFHTHALPPGKMFWVRSLAVTEETRAKPAALAPGPRAAVVAFDATPLAAFREQFRTAANKAKVRENVALGRSGEGKLPAGWAAQNYKDDTVSEVAVDAVGGGKALGITSLEGSRSTMMLTPLFETSAPNLTLKLEYMVEGAEGMALVRFVPREPREGLPVTNLTDLPATNGQWVTREFPIDAKTSTLCCLEFHTSTLALGKAFWVKSYTVTGGGPASAPASE